MEGDRMPLPGQRFCPMEDELLMFYLEPKVNGMPVPGDGDVIYELDLYGDQDPWKIWQRYEEERANDLRRNKDLYFFTQKKKTTAKSSRVRRTVGTGGTWRGQTAGKDVFLLDENHQPTTTVLGLKKTYTYRNKGSVHDGRWIMYEFELHKSQLKKQVNKNDYVLCLLRKNDLLPEKKRKRQQEEEGLEDYVEDDEAVNTDPESVSEEEPQEKRQRLLPSLEDEQEQFLQVQPAPSLEAEQEALPTPLEDDLVFLQEGEFMEWQESDFASLEQFLQDESEARPTALEAEQVSLLVDENSGLQQLEAEPQLGEDNLEQQLDAVPLFAAQKISAGIQFHPDENMVQQVGGEANMYSENLGDATQGENWHMSFAEELMNGEQPNTMEEGEWNAVYLGFDEQVSLRVDENSGLKQLQAESQFEQQFDAVPLFAAQENWSMEELTKELMNDELLNAIEVGDFDSMSTIRELERRSKLPLICIGKSQGIIVFSMELEELCEEWKKLIRIACGVSSSKSSCTGTKPQNQDYKLQTIRGSSSSMCGD
ncbi:hypothetical protein ACLB2K_031833 [Fragaria x ananassa]